jgi:hypothetical protein
MLWTLQDGGGKDLAFMRRSFFESFKRRDKVADALTASPPQRQITSGFKSLNYIVKDFQ